MQDDLDLWDYYNGADSDSELLRAFAGDLARRSVERVINMDKFLEPDKPPEDFGDFLINKYNRKEAAHADSRTVEWEAEGTTCSEGPTS